MTVTEIESAIAQLPPGELAQLMTWLQEYHVQAWDKQIETNWRQVVSMRSLPK